MEKEIILPPNSEQDSYQIQVISKNGACYWECDGKNTLMLNFKPDINTGDHAFNIQVSHNGTKATGYRLKIPLNGGAALTPPPNPIDPKEYTHLTDGKLQLCSGPVNCLDFITFMFNTVSIDPSIKISGTVPPK